MQRKRHILFVLFWMFFISILNGQTVIKHFTIEDGLPSDEVHFVHQDRYGYFWFCTDRGISRYNGYEFTNFTTQDGLSNNTVFKCFEDWDGNLWFTCIDGSITIYNQVKKKFRKFEGSDYLKQKIEKQKWTHYIGFNYETREAHFFMLENKHVDSIYSYYQNCTFISNSYSDFKYKKGQVFNNLKLIKFNDEFYKSGHLFTRPYLIVLSEDDGLSIENINEIIEEVGKQKMHKYVTCEIDKNLYFISRNGIFVKKQNDILSEVLPDEYATSLYIDNESNYWVTMVNNGVYVLVDNEIITKSKELKLLNVEKITIAKGLANRMVLSTNQSRLILIDSIGQADKYFKRTGDNQTVKRFYYYFDSSCLGYEEFLICHKNGEYQLYNFRDAYIKRKSKTSNFNLAIVDKYKNIYNDAPEKLIPLLDKHQKYKEFGKLLHPGSWYKCFLGNDFVYLVKKNMLMKLYFDNREHHKVDLGIRDDLLEITSLDTLNNFTFISTKGNGIIIISNDVVVGTLMIHDGLISEMVSAVTFDKKLNRLWVATNKGASLFHYLYVNDHITFKHLGNIVKEDGLNSNFLVDIEANNNMVYCISNKSISIVPANYQFVKYDPPSVILNGMVLNDSVYVLDNERFKSDQNNVSFQYEVVSLKKRKNTYRYRLINGVDSVNWNLTDDRNVKINNIAPGDYRFEVCARTANSEWSVPQAYTFTIEPRFIDRWWVRLVGLGLILGSAYLLYRRRIIQITEKTDLQLALSELELKNSQLESKALRGQMNPHFVFNVLNSIQKLILKENKNDANELLGRFSKLIRASLKYSRLEFIPIEDEMQFLDNYISIEGKRFPGRFTYNIKIEDSLKEENVKIPPLIIQPICENAIKHAFIEGNGTLIVNIGAIDDLTLEITIEDNGIGILNNPKKLNSESLGLDIVEDRLELFKSEGYNARMTLEAGDIKTKQGTIVTIILPYK